MHLEHQTLEKHIKRANVISSVITIVIGLLTAISVAYGFYYNTKGTLTQHTNDIQELKVDVVDVKNKVNESAVFQGVSATETRAPHAKTTTTDKKVDKVDEKLDQILLRK